MIILNAAQTEFSTFTIVVIVGFLFFTTLLYLIVYKPKYIDRILDAADTPTNYFGEGGGGILLLMVPILFIFFCCLLLVVVYGWIQVAIQ